MSTNRQHQQPLSSSSKMKTETSSSSIDELQQTFIRKAQMIEQQKLTKANIIRMRNRLSGVFMAAVVGSIYFYTIFTVKQEKFLDELDDEPSNDKK